MESVRFVASRPIAEGQEEYQTLHGHISPVDRQGVLTCCWKLSLWERLALLLRGKLWHQVLTFQQPLQPQRLSVSPPEELYGIAPGDMKAALARPSQAPS